MQAINEQKYSKEESTTIDSIVHILQMISVHYLSTSEVAAELAKDQSASSDAPYGLRIYHRVKSVLGELTLLPNPVVIPSW